MKDNKSNKEIGSRTYWFVFSLGLLYILLLGLFTYLFNNPI